MLHTFVHEQTHRVQILVPRRHPEDVRAGGANDVLKTYGSRTQTQKKTHRHSEDASEPLLPRKASRSGLLPS